MRDTASRQRQKLARMPDQSYTLLPMRVKLWRALLFVCATGTFVFGQTAKVPPKVSVCELASHPERYDGQRVTVRGKYSVHWLRGEWISSDGCSDVVRFGLPGHAWVPTPYSELTVVQDGGFRQFQMESQLVCDHTEAKCVAPEFVSAEFSGVFVAAPHFKETLGTGTTEAPALIVTGISDAGVVMYIEIPKPPPAGNVSPDVPGMRLQPLGVPDQIPLLPIPKTSGSR